jgi:predicted nucleic acid-binding Zn ribbon protein
VTWHPLPADRDAAGPDPRPVKESLDQFAKRLGAPRASALGAVFSRWDEAVGDTVAAHCRPVSLRDGLLVVMVDHPGWATQLRYLSATIVTRIEEVAGPGVVRRLEVRIRRS